VTKFRAFVGEGIRDIVRGDPLLILPLLARLASKRSRIGTDMLLITTRTSDKLLRAINIDDFERL